MVDEYGLCQINPNCDVGYYAGEFEFMMHTVND